MSFKWFIHNKTKNETAAALQAAVANGRGMLAVICKPGCAICEAGWKKLNTSALTKFLEDSNIVGLKIEDSASHCMALTSQAKLWRNPDGSKTSDTLPILAFFKPRARAMNAGLSLAKSGGDVATWFCGSTPKYVPTYATANVVKWLWGIMLSDAYNQACPGTAATTAQPTRYAVSVTAVFTATFDSKAEAQNAAKLFEIKPHGGWEIIVGKPQVEPVK